MGFDAGRLRRGELIAGGGGILLLVAVFLLPWFGINHAAGTLASTRASTSLDGWHALTDIRWVLLIAIVASVALVAVTAMRDSPAVPVTLGMVMTLLGVLSSLLVLYRVIDNPGAGSSGASVHAKAGIYLGLLACLAIAYGGYRSLRAEGSGFEDPEGIEIVILETGGPEVAPSPHVTEPATSSVDQPPR